MAITLHSVAKLPIFSKTRNFLQTFFDHVTIASSIHAVNPYHQNIVPSANACKPTQHHSGLNLNIGSGIACGWRYMSMYMGQ